MPSAALRRAPLALAATALAVVLAACSPPSAPTAAGAPGQPSAALPATGLAAPLSDAEFDALTVDEQYRVTNKLLATLYSGVPVADHHDLSSGRALRSRRADAPTPASIRAALATKLDPLERERLDLEIVGDDAAVDEDGVSAPIEPMFKFDGNRPKQMPLARMMHYPHSRERYSQWMAWHLANTILFSPAEEIDSADVTDVQNLFRRLDLAISEGKGIREIIATHQRTVENWRRFRSPEDNTREMMEIYLGLFDNDAEVPLASQACQDLYLTDERDGYKLARTDFPNSENVLVLDRYVLDCNDFYDVVAGHPLVIPRVVGILVDHFHAGRTSEERLAITEAIAATKPVTFEDVFTAILFSRSYLLDTERLRSFEESYLSMAARLAWEPHHDVLMGMTSGRGGLSRTRMDEMGWSAMSLKLGRTADVPSDALSVANHHKALRETLMLDQRRWNVTLGLASPPAPEPAPPEPLDENASPREIARHDDRVNDYEEALAALDPDARAAHTAALEDYESEAALFRLVTDLNVAEAIDYLFLAAIQRRATAAEREALHALFFGQGHLDADLENRFVRPDRLDDVGAITLDYLSRLPETYYLPRLNAGADR